MSIAEHLARRLKKESGYGTRPVTGAGQGDWVLVDAGDIYIVHILVFPPGSARLLRPGRHVVGAVADADYSMRRWIFAIGSAPAAAAQKARYEMNISDAPSSWAAISSGFSAMHVEELSIGKARDAKTRMSEEAGKLAARLPDGAHIVLLDARGKGMTSEDFAEMLAALRDAGTRDLVFVIGGPDGLAPLPGKKPGRSLAFGPQTWPHLLARSLLSEQVYRAVTILAGHPYHRP